MKVIGRLAKWFSRWRSVPSEHDLLRTVDLGKLSRAINYSIRDRQLFLQALSHRSYFQENGNGALGSNERMEFLGDAVLNLIVAKRLFEQHESSPEGDLTKGRSRLVNRKSLSIYAHQVHLEDFMLIGVSATRTDGRGMSKILADAFEALVAAIYLDGGNEAAREFIDRQINSALRDGTVTTDDENFKSQLLEYAQAEGLSIPRYATINEEGPDHDRTFTVEVYVGNDPHGVGMGKNKKDAEQAAAEKALQKLQLI